MRVDAFMKIGESGGATILQSKSSDQYSNDERIEILTFEHCLERTPVRSVGMDLGTWALTHGYLSEDSEPAERLANNLHHGAFSVFKVFDKNSPVLHSWATKKDALLDVEISVRLPYPVDQNTVESLAAYRITMTEAYIGGIALVGNFAAQPWLPGASQFPLKSAPLLDHGPIERIEFRYTKIQWVYGNPTAGSDVESGVHNGIRPEDRQN